jgi:hypothetical protein
MSITTPTDTLTTSQDKDLPSYEIPAYRKQKPKWDFVADMFEGRSAWFSFSAIHASGRITNPIKALKYLPLEAEEPEDEYVKRLSRSYFVRKFRDSIESFSGFLSSFVLSEDTHPGIIDYKDDVDLQGNSLEVFLRTADIKALRDDHCFILTEFPRRPEFISNALEEREYKLRPYFVLIDARDVLNWKLAPDNRTLLQVTIREKVHEDSGMYGTEEKTRYRVLTPGKYQIFEIDNGGLLLVEEGFTSLDYIPLEAYSLTNTDGSPWIGEPPLYDLAELNLKHYQKTSEKDEAMHKCNMAVLEVQELSPNPRGENEPEPMVRIGPNTCLWNVSARFVEPSGSAIGATQADIDRLEMEMDKRTLSFLSGNEVQRTATEVSMFGAPVQANLSSMARAKQSNSQRLFKNWAAYLKPVAGKGTGSVIVDEKILQAAMDAGTLGALLQVRGAGEISRKTFLTLLKQGKALPKDLDIDNEIKALQDEAKTNMTLQLQYQSAAAAAQATMSQ